MSCIFCSGKENTIQKKERRNLKIKLKFESRSGITLIALVVTIVVLLILASVSIATLTGEKGIIKEARTAKEETERASIEEQIELAIIKAEEKYKNPTMDNVIGELKNNKVISNDSQVDKTTGTVTTDLGYVFEGKLEDYSELKKYYGITSVMPTNQKYFSYTLDEATKTATITGIKSEYQVKAFYGKNDEIMNYGSMAINDNGTYITDVVIPYQIMEENNIYVVNKIGEWAFSITHNEKNNEYNSYFPLRADAYFRSFILPNTINSIGEYAFYTCVKLENISIPSSVRNVGNRAFFRPGSIWTNEDDVIDIYCEVTSKPDYWSEVWYEGSDSGRGVVLHWGQLYPSTN